ncbi:sulfonate ABC transporter substrate-binding protein [Heyndrickxia coagulans]|uniref:sulfonate ABC transporter substrate-binding protein n=1 Tax=Heyndrickxia coagulans TaxID=1398 RepID=UPI0006288324|nr:sulfonate ABC transporter substrate-binding protein [Heyndrickxia coagulans]
MLKKRKRLVSVHLLLITAIFLLISGCSSAKKDTAAAKSGEKGGKVVRIGYQKFGTLNILKAKGTLEKALKPLGYSVKWTEFPGGPQLLEALNAGSLDFGHTGEAPPIFAQAAGAPLVYFANSASNPKGEAIIVPKNSNIHSLKGLKGKKIALNKGSNVHYLLVRALEKAGIPYSSIHPVFLAPADARTAFEKGDVDAWVIWDPFLADAQLATKARTIADGTGLVENREFFLAAKPFAQNHADVLDVIFKQLEKTERWVEKNPKQAAEFLAPQIGMDKKSLELTLSRKNFGTEKITTQTLKDQQQIANEFYKLKLIPKPIKVKEAFLSK